MPPGSEDTEDDSEEDEMEIGSASSGLEDTADSLTTNGYEWHIDKYDHFKFFIQYRGKCTEQLAKALHNCKAPCKVIMTLRKLKTVMLSLKPEVEYKFRSGVVYQIVCPRCQASYVGKTSRHLLTRYTEHKNNKGPVKAHFSSCDVPLSLEDISILSSTIKSEEHLFTLEALYIKELSPVLNTQETYRSRTLKIRF